jgi:osmoprotectant transport system permease protein
LSLKPNRIAPGISFKLFALPSEWGPVLLFALAVLPIALALLKRSKLRGWLLASFGNALLVLILYLPALGGADLVAHAKDILGEGVILRNPRLLPSAALALGLAGGYTVLFGGLVDLTQAGVSRAARAFASWWGAGLIALLLILGKFNIYSVLVEFHARGEQLGQHLLAHVLFVAVSLAVGFVVGVGLGLWASRDKRLSPVILYAVGIIQTIPSLALFGVLLVPMSRLGNQLFTTVGIFFIIAVLVASALIALFLRFAERLSGRWRVAGLLLSATVGAVPLALFTVVLVSFVFAIVLITFTSGIAIFGNLRLAMLAALILAVLLSALGHWAGGRLLRYASVADYLVLAGLFVATLGVASSHSLANVSFAAMTLRDLGVSGIGTAPAVVALALYSLLPLVRNTYAGLGNVDPAIVDSGRGMGMTRSQIFFQIELPIALPVIIAGVRNAGVALVGIGAVAAVIGAGGLGTFILQGIYNTSIDLILLGLIPAVLLAFALDTGLRLLGNALTSPGIRQL